MNSSSSQNRVTPAFSASNLGGNERGGVCVTVTERVSTVKLG